MSVKANWGSAAADPVTDIPADDPVARIEQLVEALADLTHQEGELFNCGVTCPIRDSHDSVCSVCPLSHHMDRLHPLQPLCTVGRKTERTLTLLTIAQHEKACAA